MLERLRQYVSYARLSKHLGQQVTQLRSTIERVVRGLFGRFDQNFLLRRLQITWLVCRYTVQVNFFRVTCCQSTITRLPNHLTASGDSVNARTSIWGARAFGLSTFSTASNGK